MTEAQRENNKTQRQKAVDLVNSLKTPCVKCGEHRVYMIDFHHIDNATKEFDINKGMKSKGRKCVMQEVAKCVCLCRNCHAEFHHIYGVTPLNPKENLEEFIGKEGGHHSVL